MAEQTLQEKLAAKRLADSQAAAGTTGTDIKKEGTDPVNVSKIDQTKTGTGQPIGNGEVTAQEAQDLNNAAMGNRLAEGSNAVSTVNQAQAVVQNVMAEAQAQGVTQEQMRAVEGTTNLQDMLRARAVAVAQAKHDGAIPGNRELSGQATIPPNLIGDTLVSSGLVPAGLVNTIGTGIQSSTDVVQVHGGYGQQQVGKINPDLANKAEAVFETTGLRRFFRRDGIVNAPTDGYFYAQDDEDVAILEDFAKQGKVKRV